MRVVEWMGYGVDMYIFGFGLRGLLHVLSALVRFMHEIPPFGKGISTYYIIFKLTGVIRSIVNGQIERLVFLDVDP